MNKEPLCTFRTFYIAKVMKGPDGEEAMLINDVPYGVRGPYRVVYDEKDGVSVGS